MPMQITQKKSSAPMQRSERDWTRRIEQRLERQRRRVRRLLQTVEHETMELIDGGLERLEQQIEQTVPDLAPIVEGLRSQVEQADNALKDVVGVAPESLPIPDYDKMNVREALRHITKLDEDELWLIARYEKEHKNRLTVLTEIQCRLKVTDLI